MCGVFGFVGFKNDKLLKKMGQTLAHRGPDDQEQYTEDKIGLGYRRLAIIDTGGSFQPLFNEDKSIVLFFNGEIYNYKSLREKLGKHKFKTFGDGETITHWYEEHGPSSFQQLNGIFAFCLFDKKRGKLLLVRDHFGIKPIYYFAGKEFLVFASEIKAILPVLKSKKISITPDMETIQKYLLSRLHDDKDDTFFEGIKRLPPASYLELDVKTKEFRVDTYWQLKPDHTLIEKSEAENIKKFRNFFQRAIERQLMSEVPLGTALSGGLDSSAVVLTVNESIRNKVPSIKEGDWQKVIGDKQKTFSAVFPGQINNEKEFIAEVAKISNVDSHLVEPKREGLWKEIAQVIYHQDEPMISSGPYAQWKVMELAGKNKIKVMLDGQGADEMLAGYDAYFFVYLRELFAKGDYFQFLKELVLSIDILWKYIREKAEYLVGIKQQFSVSELFNFPNSSSQLAYARGNSTNLNQRLLEDTTSKSLPSLLRYEDKNSMAFSIEARVPFLDFELVEFVASLPANYKIRNGWNKWIMRQALQDILPGKILKRRWKVGFTTPEIAWLRQSTPEIQKILNSTSFNSRPYFNQAKIREAFEQFVQGKNDESMVFWRIINLELWLRIFID